VQRAPIVIWPAAVYLTALLSRLEKIRMRSSASAWIMQSPTLSCSNERQALGPRLLSCGFQQAAG